MELGARIRQARLEAGLSQRALCGERITRNMLSQIENGSAKPSMDTLCYLAEALEKPVSFFLGECIPASPNAPVVNRARTAWEAGDWAQVLQLREAYRSADASLDREWTLLQRLATLQAAEAAIGEGKQPYAVELLTRLGTLSDGYCAPELERQRLLLLARADSRKRSEVCAALPSLDAELCLRARAALETGDFARCEALLLAAEKQDAPEWNLLRGACFFSREEYAQAAQCFHLAETAFPDRTAPRLEQCYRELGDFKQAYFYACKQR